VSRPAARASKLITATIAFRPIALNPFIPLRLFAIGPQEKRLGDRQAERLGGRQIDDEIELGRLFDRDIARLRPAQNFVSLPRNGRAVSASPHRRQRHLRQRRWHRGATGARHDDGMGFPATPSTATVKRSSAATVQGALRGKPLSRFTVEVFGSRASGSSEGERFLGDDIAGAGQAQAEGIAGEDIGGDRARSRSCARARAWGQRDRHSAALGSWARHPGKSWRGFPAPERRRCRACRHSVRARRSAGRRRCRPCGCRGRNYRRRSCRGHVRRRGQWQILARGRCFQVRRVAGLVHRHPHVTRRCHHDSKGWITGAWGCHT
jgi:hypothetical protein